VCLLDEIHDYMTNCDSDTETLAKENADEGLPEVPVLLERKFDTFFKIKGRKQYSKKLIRYAIYCHVFVC